MTVTSGPISRDDIEAKFRELQGEMELIEDEARNYAGIVVIVGVVAVVAVAFVLGRRRGRGRRRGGRTVVEIRQL